MPFSTDSPLIFAVGRQTGEVDPGDDVAVAWRDPRDAVGVPDVGVDLALDVFEFVELLDRFAAVRHEEMAVSLKVAGSRNLRVAVPSLVMISLAVRVIPQPSPV